MQNTYLFGFATFGHPNDYRQSAFKFENEEIAKSVKIFDLPNAIKIFPNSTLYAIRKENIEGSLGVSYTIYTYAKEMNSARDGTFIGSGILYRNLVGEEKNTIENLNNFHNILVDRNTVDDILTVNHSKYFTHSTSFLNDFEEIPLNVRPIENLENFVYANKNIVIGSRIDVSTLTRHLKKSLALLNKYDTIFFTNSRDIIGYCKEKDIYPITDEKGFEKELQKLEEEEIQKRQYSIGEFENERKKLFSDKKRLFDEHKSQIEKNKKIHQQNIQYIEDFKKQLDTISQIYDAFSKKIDESIINLKSNQKIEKVRQLHIENKRIFIDSVVQHTRPIFVNKIPNQEVETEPRQAYQPLKIKSYEPDFANQEHRKRRKDKISILTLLSATLFLLWVGTLTYFLSFQMRVSVPLEVHIQQNEKGTTERSNVRMVSKKELSPVPNTELSKNEYISAAKEIKINMNIKDIVQIIFNKNPTDIKKTYSNQPEEYAKKIVELNRDCFKKERGDFFLLKDTIRHIPSYKK